MSYPIVGQEKPLYIHAEAPLTCISPHENSANTSSNMIGKRKGGTCVCKKGTWRGRGEETRGGEGRESERGGGLSDWASCWLQNAEFANTPAAYFANIHYTCEGARGRGESTMSVQEEHLHRLSVVRPGSKAFVSVSSCTELRGSRVQCYVYEDTKKNNLPRYGTPLNIRCPLIKLLMFLIRARGMYPLIPSGLCGVKRRSAIAGTDV